MLGSFLCAYAYVCRRPNREKSDTAAVREPRFDTPNAAERAVPDAFPEEGRVNQKPS